MISAVQVPESETILRQVSIDPMTAETASYKNELGVYANYLKIDISKKINTMNKPEGKVSHIYHMANFFVVAIADDSPKSRRSVVFLFNKGITNPQFNYVVDHPNRVIEVAGLEFDKPDKTAKTVVHILLLIEETEKFTLQQLFPALKKIKPIISFNKWESQLRNLNLTAVFASEPAESRARDGTGKSRSLVMVANNERPSRDTSEKEVLEHDAICAKHLRPTFKAFQSPEYFNLTINVEPMIILNLRFKATAEEWSNMLRDAYKKKNLLEDGSKIVKAIVDLNISHPKTSGVKDATLHCAVLIVTGQGYQVKLLSITGMHLDPDLHYISNINVLHTIDLHSADTIDTRRHLLFTSIYFEHIIKRIVLLGASILKSSREPIDCKLTVIVIKDPITDNINDMKESSRPDVVSVFQNKIADNIPIKKLAIKSRTCFYQIEDHGNNLSEESMLALFISANLKQLVCLEVNKDRVFGRSSFGDLATTVNKIINPTTPLTEVTGFDVIKPLVMIGRQAVDENKSKKTGSTADAEPKPQPTPAGNAAVAQLQKFSSVELYVAYAGCRFTTITVKFRLLNETQFFGDLSPKKESDYKDFQDRTTYYGKKITRIQSQKDDSANQWQA